MHHLIAQWAPTGSIGCEMRSNGLRLRYRHIPYGGTEQHVDEAIPVTTSTMHFAGCRHWFGCLSCDPAGSRLAARTSAAVSIGAPSTSRSTRVNRCASPAGDGVSGSCSRNAEAHGRRYRHLGTLDEEFGPRWCIAVGGLRKYSPVGTSFERFLHAGSKQVVVSHQITHYRTWRPGASDARLIIECARGFL